MIHDGLRRLPGDVAPVLHEQFPELFTAQALECSQIGAGWFAIATDALSELQAIRDQGHNVLVTRVKEKLGTLRVQSLLCDQFAYSQDAGGLRALQAARRAKIIERLGHITARAFERSRFVCETCGDPGSEFRKSGNIKVLCELHREQTRRGASADPFWTVPDSD